MLKSWSLRGLLVVSGSVVALTAAMLPAQAASTGWRAAATFSVKDGSALLSGIDAVSATDAWAAGGTLTSAGNVSGALIEHWAGKSWDKVTLPSEVAAAAKKAEDVFDAVAASSAANVWVFSEVPVDNDSYLHYNGKAWTDGALPGTSISSGQAVEITSAEALSTSDVWVFGGKLKITDTTETFVPYAAQFNGKSWVSKSVPGSGEITAASVISAGNIWAVTGTSDLEAGIDSSVSGGPGVLHWNGTSWQAATKPAKLPAHADLTAVNAQSGGVVWVGGAVISGGKTTTEFSDKLTGSTWAAAPTDLKGSASSSSCAPASLVPDGQGGLWALGLCLEKPSSALWHFTGGTWSSVGSPKFGASGAVLLQLAAVPGTSSVWGAGATEVGKATSALVAIDGATPS